MIILDGKITSSNIEKEIIIELNTLRRKGLKKPHLAAILVGNDGASETYIKAKIEACERVGFESTLVRFDSDIEELVLITEIDRINKDSDIDGLIVQLPLPDSIDEMKIAKSILPSKDVDGFHPFNVGNMALNSPSYIPATPAGVLELLERYHVETSGKHCVVIGRSNIVGSPISILMSRDAYPGNSTVTLIHSRTNNLKNICKTADILIVALGKPNFITVDMVKDGVCIIDVGITRVRSDITRSGWKLIGDVSFDEVKDKCSFITPVPGGVGPMTISMLLKNTLRSVKNRI